MPTPRISRQEFVTERWQEWREALLPDVPTFEEQVDFCRAVGELYDLAPKTPGRPRKDSSCASANKP